ncbi:hypothetical protein DFH27DRAFT_328330 [Peziza echinospora]|nr:hypothetical protein DFH27DRAFT_328330 [Peziza echinospora]
MSLSLLSSFSYLYWRLCLRFLLFSFSLTSLFFLFFLFLFSFSYYSLYFLDAMYGIHVFLLMIICICWDFILFYFYFVCLLFLYGNPGCRGGYAGGYYIASEFIYEL